MKLPNLEIERIRLGMNKSEYADYLGVSTGTLRNWQNGKNEIPMSRLVDISKTLHVSTDYILGLTELR